MALFEYGRCGCSLVEPIGRPSSVRDTDCSKSMTSLLTKLIVQDPGVTQAATRQRVCSCAANAVVLGPRYMQGHCPTLGTGLVSVCLRSTHSAEGHMAFACRRVDSVL